MLMPRAFRDLSVASAALSVFVFVNSAHAQDPAPATSSLQNEVAGMKAENVALREQLRQLEEQQKTLLEQVERLQRRLDAVMPAVAQPSGPSQVADAAEPLANDATTAVPASNAGNASAQQASVETAKKVDRYDDGIVIWQNPEDAKVPLLLKLNDDTQIRYLNTTDSPTTFTDHLGVVREVHTRNDITINRSMFNFNGYIFDPRLLYSLKVWTSAGAASIVVAGNIGWKFNKALTIIGGYTGVPGSRSLVNTFPFFQTTDRTMADNFFRPGFTQGAWAFG